MQYHRLRQAIESLDYSVRFAETGAWTRCLIGRPGETWIGEGIDESAAFNDAANRMLPSEGARALLLHRMELEGQLAALRDQVPEARRAAIEEQARREQLEAEIEALNAQLSSLRKELAGARLQTAGVEAVRQAEERGRQTLADALGISTSQWGDLLDAIRTLRSPVEAEVEAEVEAPVEVPVGDDATDEPTLREQRLIALAEEIDESIPIVVMASAPWQRAQLTCWAAQAKAIEGRRRSLRGTAVMHRLQDLAHSWWPGAALGLRATDTPERCTAQFPGPGSRGWDEVVSVWQREIDGETAFVLHDHEDLGWSDAQALGDPPSDPDEVLDDAVRVIEAMAGPLDGEARVGGELDAEAMSEALAQLRWIRLCCTWPERWGRAMGRARWLVDGERKCRGGRVLDYLDPSWCPGHGRTWASIAMGYQGSRVAERERVALERERERAFAAMPVPHCARDRLSGWLQSAFALWDTDELAPMLLHLRADVARIDGSAFDERGTRSRLLRLQRSMAALTSPEETEAEEPEVEEERAEDPIFEQAREYTRGKRILMVLNRKDSHLERQLRDAFEAEIEVAVGSSAKEIKRLELRSKQGTFDAVWFAHSFNSHTNDRVLSRAAKSAGVPFLRVGKGRASQVAQAVLASHGEGA